MELVEALRQFGFADGARRKAAKDELIWEIALHRHCIYVRRRLRGWYN